MLDLLGVPYVGSARGRMPAGLGQAHRQVAWSRAAGLATPDWVALPHATFRELGAPAVLDRLVDRLGLPLMVKPAQGGSALGRDRRPLRPRTCPAAMVGCFAYGDTALVERYVDGVEVAVSVIDDGDGPQALPAVEIVPTTGVFDYAARYTPGMTTYFTPARLDADVAAAGGRRRGHRAPRARAAGPVPRSTRSSTPTAGSRFLEVNVAPGMTETSLLPMAVAAAGHDLGAVCAGMLRRAAARSAAVTGSTPA